MTRCRVIQKNRRIYSKPRDYEPSKFVYNSLNNIETPISDRPVLDIGCGYGRNGLEVLRRGYRCVFCDADYHCLSDIDKSPYFENYRKQNQYRLCQIDFDAKDWFFPQNSCIGIVNVHYYNERLIDYFLQTVCIGGFLIIETINNSGSNYLELPKKDFLIERISRFFDIIDYSEGKENHGKCSVKLFAIKC